MEAFDTLFNKRDYAAAERYWSPHYIQHSNHIEPGRDGLFNLIKSLPPTLKYEAGVIVAGGEICRQAAEVALFAHSLGNESATSQTSSPTKGITSID